MEQKILDLINETRSMNVRSIREYPERAFVVINLLCDEVVKHDPIVIRTGDFVRVTRNPSDVPKDVLGSIGLVTDMNNDIALIKINSVESFWIKIKDLRLYIIKE
jgi:hypothetical protein